jgi:hypothetical protein
MIDPALPRLLHRIRLWMAGRAAGFYELLRHADRIEKS